jgi:hypothetical protein
MEHRSSTDKPHSIEKLFNATKLERKRDLFLA